MLLFLWTVYGKTDMQACSENDPYTYNKDEQELLENLFFTATVWTIFYVENTYTCEVCSSAFIFYYFIQH